MAKHSPSSAPRGSASLIQTTRQSSEPRKECRTDSPREATDEVESCFGNLCRCAEDPVDLPKHFARRQRRRAVCLDRGDDRDEHVSGMSEVASGLYRHK